MQRIVLSILTILISYTGFSQSFFKPIPKPLMPNRYSLALTSTTSSPDSTFVGFRPVVSVAVYGYTKQQGNSLFTGAGISYEHDTWNSSTSKWYTDWSVGALFYAGGAAAPTGPTAVEAAGLNLSFFNKLLSVGGAYNFQSQSFMPTIGLSISLNN